MVTVSQRHEGFSPTLRLRPTQILWMVAAVVVVWHFHLLVRHLGTSQQAKTAQSLLDVPLERTSSGYDDGAETNRNVPKIDVSRKAQEAGGARKTPGGNLPEISADKEVAKNIGVANGKVVPTIGYFISITGCGSSNIADGAAVVKHSIHMSSIHGNLGGNYDYKMHAIVHPVAAGCVQELADLGYELEERDTPVQVKDMKGEFLRKKIELNGCCGEKELIKLWAYTFTQYPVVVHLDLDTLILKPLDTLFDAMIMGGEASFSKIERMWPKEPVPNHANALFTRDFGMVKGGRKYKPVQGGFLVLRPDQSVYNEYVEILREGDFQEGKGWGGKRVGPFYGSMTIQGILPYYYDVLHPGESMDLNRCVYDQMCDNPRDQKTINDVVHGNCRTGELECEDCRSRPLEDIASVHFTLCQKPWHCLPHDQDRIQHRLCRKLHREWYRIRSDMEESWGRSGTGPGTWKDSKQFFGYCKCAGKRCYVPIAPPYGKLSQTQQ